MFKEPKETMSKGLHKMKMMSHQTENASRQKLFFKSTYLRNMVTKMKKLTEGLNSGYELA